MSEKLLVLVLEEIVATELSESLERVSNKSGSPSSDKSFRSFDTAQNTHVTEHTLVESLGIVLLVALYHIDGRDTAVSQSAREDTSETAYCFVCLDLSLDF